MQLSSRSGDQKARDQKAGGQTAADDTRALVFIEKIKGASRLVKVDARALADGLSQGMALADARVRVPALRAVAYSGAADAGFLARLAEVCGAFTPSVANEDPDGLVLDITGCVHLFGDERGLARRLQNAVRAIGISVSRLAIAATPEMARALARFANTSPVIATDDSLVRALGVAALERQGHDALALRRAGLRSIGDIADRPSVLFSARFTQAFTTHLARVLGEEDRRIVPLRAAPTYLLDHRCAEPVATDTVILGILGDLAARAGRLLEAHGAGGRVFDTLFFRTDGAVRRIRIETSQPTRDPAVLLRLYRDRLDALADPLDPGFGYDLIRFHVVRAEPCDMRQTSLDAQGEQQAQIAQLVDRLGAMFGQERVYRLQAIDTHVPERAQGVRPAAHAMTAAPWASAIAGAPPSRPLHLFAAPHPIDMAAATGPGCVKGCVQTGGRPEDGRLGRFRWRRAVHEIARTEGPERIAEDWWTAPSGFGTRDYYRIETAQGRRFWIFRADATAPAASARWFLHGVFA